MNIQQKLNAALKVLVGADTDGRPCCYPNTLPENPTFPALVYQFITNPPAASLTQLARYTDFHAQVTARARDYNVLLALRSSILLAVEAMPEYVTRDTDIEGAFEFEPKAFNWILGFQFRDAET